jgi:hypothetical protein
MSPATWWRVALAAGTAWLLIGLESTIVGGEQHYRDWLMFVPWTLTMVTWAGLYDLQRRRFGWFGTVAFAVLEIAMAIAWIGQAGVVLDIDVLAGLAFPLGAMLFGVGLVCAGAATYRAELVPRRYGVLLAGLEVLSVLNGILFSPIAGLHDRGSYSGGIAKGIVLLLVMRAACRAAAGEETSRNAQEVASSGSWGTPRRSPEPTDARWSSRTTRTSGR